jgi:hypothetical protein
MSEQRGLEAYFGDLPDPRVSGRWDYQFRYHAYRGLRGLVQGGWLGGN